MNRNLIQIALKHLLECQDIPIITNPIIMIFSALINNFKLRLNEPLKY